jgi:hypothetical protein
MASRKTLLATAVLFERGTRIVSKALRPVRVDNSNEFYSARMKLYRTALFDASFRALCTFG